MLWCVLIMSIKEVDADEGYQSVSCIGQEQ